MRPISEIDRYAGDGGGPRAASTLEPLSSSRARPPIAQRGDSVCVTVSCQFWVARNGLGAENGLVRSELAILDRKAVFIEPRPPSRTVCAHRRVVVVGGVAISFQPWARPTLGDHDVFNRDWSCSGVQSQTGYRYGHRVTNQLNLRSSGKFWARKFAIGGKRSLFEFGHLVDDSIATHSRPRLIRHPRTHRRRLRLHDAMGPPKWLRGPPLDAT